jgi:hypothetical protein
MKLLSYEASVINKKVKIQYENKKRESRLPELPLIVLRETKIRIRIN